MSTSSNIEPKVFIAGISILITIIWTLLSFLHVNNLDRKGYTKDCNAPIQMYNIVMYIQFAILSIYTLGLMYNMKSNRTRPNISFVLGTAIIQGIVSICLNSIEWSTLYKLQKCRNMKDGPKSAYQFNSIFYVAKIINIIALSLSVCFMLGMMLVIKKQSMLNT
jgi:hypothetical protein